MRLTQSHNGIALIYRIAKKEWGSTQANTATKLYTLDAFRGKNAQYTQQNKENRRGNRKQRKGRGDERGKIENGF